MVVAVLAVEVQVVAQPQAVQVVAQRVRGTPATRVVKQDLPAQGLATRVVKQERQGPATGVVKQETTNVLTSRCLPQRLHINKRGIEASKNAPSAAPQGIFPSRNQAVPPPNARTSSGTGTAPNGRPIGSVGSGPGSPEQPH